METNYHVFFVVSKATYRERKRETFLNRAHFSARTKITLCFSSTFPSWTLWSYAAFSLWLQETRFLVNDQRDAQILLYVFMSIYNSLHVSSTSCSSTGETNCINTSSGNSHSMLVAEMCAGWKNTLSLLLTCTCPYDHISLNSSQNEKCFWQKLWRKSKHTFYVQ